MTREASIGIGWVAAIACVLMACDQQQPLPYTNTTIAPIAQSGAAGGAPRPAPSGAAGGGAMPVQMPVMCGTTMCQPAMAFGMLRPLAPCCADAATALCGWQAAGSTACTKPPAVDPECPVLPTGQKGCCITAQNKCGIDASRFGSDCFDLSMLPAMPGGMAPAVVDCDGKPIATGGAGGASSAGAGGMSGGAGGAPAAGAGGASSAGAGGARAGAGGTSGGGTSGGTAGSPASGGAGGR